MYKLIEKSPYVFIYSQRNEDFNYTEMIEIGDKDTDNYKGVQVSCFQQDVNLEGFNNSVGLRRNELLRLPFMILHFKLYKLFHNKRR